MALRNIVSECADVSDVQIGKELARGANLQEDLKCGTFRGSCVPEITRVVAEFRTEEIAPA